MKLFGILSDSSQNVERANNCEIISITITPLMYQFFALSIQLRIHFNFIYIKLDTGFAGFTPYAIISRKYK